METDAFEATKIYYIIEWRSDKTKGEWSPYWLGDQFKTLDEANADLKKLLGRQSLRATSRHYRVIKETLIREVVSEAFCISHGAVQGLV